MWGVLQQGISTLDVDFRAYAAEHFDRLLANAATPRFERALHEVAGCRAEPGDRTAAAGRPRGQHRRRSPSRLRLAAPARSPLRDARAVVATACRVVLGAVLVGAWPSAAGADRVSAPARRRCGGICASATAARRPSRHRPDPDDGAAVQPRPATPPSAGGLASTAAPSSPAVGRPAASRHPRRATRCSSVPGTSVAATAGWTRRRPRSSSGRPGIVFTLGDNAYNGGTAAELRDCYGPGWGRVLDRTRFAVAGQPRLHDRRTRPRSRRTSAMRPFAMASPGSRRTSASWHVIVLDAQLRRRSRAAAGADSPQVRWLRDDLAASGARCTLALWHQPRFSSGDATGTTPPSGRSGTRCTRRARTSCSTATTTTTSASRRRTRRARRPRRAGSRRSSWGPAAAALRAFGGDRAPTPSSARAIAYGVIEPDAPAVRLDVPVPVHGRLVHATRARAPATERDARAAGADRRPAPLPFGDRRDMGRWRLSGGGRARAGGDHRRRRRRDVHRVPPRGARLDRHRPAGPGGADLRVRRSTAPGWSASCGAP